MSQRPVIACLGAGRMGRGIAVAFAYAGHEVAIVDFKPRDADKFKALEAEAIGEVRKTFSSMARFGLLKDADIETLVSRVHVVPEADAGAALSGSAIIFEGVPEVLDQKRERGLVWIRITWQTGATSEHRLQRRVRSYADCSSAEQLRQRVRDPSNHIPLPSQ